MKYFFAAITSFLIFASSQVSCSTVSISSPQKSDSRFGDTEILNYEYTNKYYVEDIRRSHFLINIEIGKPLIVNIELPKMDPIYINSPITGTAIVRITTDNNGKITNYSFIKKAGLGLDDYVEKMISKIEIRPIRHKGERGSSDVIARFVFSENH